jgi:YHS domain-containing protein
MPFAPPAVMADHLSNTERTDSDLYERDPVSGETVDAQTAAHLEYAGRIYYFTSTENQEQFANDPERFVTPELRSHATRPAP